MVEFSLDELTSKPYLNGFVESGVDKQSGAKLFRWKPYKDMGKDKIVFKKHEFGVNSYTVIYYYDGEYIYLLRCTDTKYKIYDIDLGEVPMYDTTIHRDYIMSRPVISANDKPIIFIDYTHKKDIEITGEELKAIIIQIHVYLWESYLCNFGDSLLAFTNKLVNKLSVDKLGITINFDLASYDFQTRLIFNSLSYAFRMGGDSFEVKDISRYFEVYEKDIDKYKDVFDLGLPRFSFRCENLRLSYVDGVPYGGSLFESFVSSLSGDNEFTSIGLKGNNSDIYTIVGAIITSGYVSTKSDRYYSIKTDKLRELREFFDANKDSSFTLTGVDNYSYIHVLEEGAYRERLMQLLYTAIDCIGYSKYDTEKLFGEFDLIALYDNREKPLIKKYIEANEITEEDCKAGLVFFSSDTIHDIIERGTDKYSEVIYCTIFFLVGMFQKLWSRDIRDIKGIKKNLSSDSIKWEVE